MATIDLSNLTSRYRDFDDAEEEVWVKHYSSNHQILLVGEGDFSFSRCLATLFGSASNICASSLDSYDEVIRKYKNARSNLETLNKLGAFLLHGVDATTLHLHPDLRCRRFDRVIYNFPHAGFHGKESDSCQIRKHRELVFGFFHGASRMLRADGEVHVSHKNTAPFCHWNLEVLASRCFLVLTQCVDFKKSEYPGYENKRGDGSRCDEPFLLGKCSTYKFKFSRVSKELYTEKVRGTEAKKHKSKFPPTLSNKHSITFDHVYPLQTVTEGISQRPVLFDLSYCRDHNLRQVQDPLVQSRQRTSPLGLYYNQQCRYPQFEDPGFAPERNHARFQDNLVQADKLRYSERSNMLSQDLFPTNHHRQEQFHRRHHLLGPDYPVQASQEPFSERSNRLGAVSLDICDGITQRMLTRTRLPHLYARESPLRHRLCDPDYPVQVSQEPLYEHSNDFSGVSHGVVRETSTCTSIPHPYTGESQDYTLTRQRNFNIQSQHHGIL